MIHTTYRYVYMYVCPLHTEECMECYCNTCHRLKGVQEQVQIQYEDIQHLHHG